MYNTGILFKAKARVLPSPTRLHMQWPNRYTSQGYFLAFSLSKPFYLKTRKREKEKGKKLVPREIVRCTFCTGQAGRRGRRGRKN